MLGPRQERWLTDGLAKSDTRWNVIAQQVPMAQINRSNRLGRTRYAMDKWDGYRVARRRLLEFLGARGIENPVVLSGDIHRHVASDLRLDFSRPEIAAVATEFITSSISSRGDGRDMDPRYTAWLEQNSHIRFIADLRGYTRFTVSAGAWRTDFRTVDRVSSPGGKIRTRAHAVVESGKPYIIPG